MSRSVDNLASLIYEAVNEGVQSGCELFMENIEEDLQRSALIEEAGGIDAIINEAFA